MLGLFREGKDHTRKSNFESIEKRYQRKVNDMIFCPLQVSIYKPVQWSGFLRSYLMHSVGRL